MPPPRFGKTKKRRREAPMRTLTPREKAFLQALEYEARGRKVLSRDFGGDQLKLAWKLLRNDGYLVRDRSGWSLTGRGLLALDTWGLPPKKR